MEVVSKTVLNPVVESDKSANDDVNGAGRGRSYISRLKGTLDYETPLNINLFETLPATSQFPGHAFSGAISAYNDFYSAPVETTVGGLVGNITRAPILSQGLADINDLAPIQYRYANEEHSIDFTDTRANYKIMVETGNSGSLVRLGVTAMGNVNSSPYDTPPALPTELTGALSTAYFPTSGVRAWFVNGRSGAGTMTPIDNIQGLTLDFGFEIAHNAILNTTATATGYAVPTVTKVMPMVELTRLYSNNATLNNLVNTESKVNNEDTRFGLLVAIENSAGNTMLFWLPRVNVTEPTYGDDSDVKTQSFTVEQQHRHNAELPTDNDLLAAVYYEQAAAISTGASGTSEPEGDE